MQNLQNIIMQNLRNGKNLGEKRGGMANHHYEKI